MAKKEYVTYNGFPIVKQGNVIYYGNFYDDFIIEMTVLAQKEVGDTQVPSRISVKLIKTDENLSPSQRIVGAPAERKSMSDAMTLAHNWLSKKVQVSE